jgi:hypothetical protein
MPGKKPAPEIMSVEQLRIYLKIDWKAAKELLETGAIPGRMIRGRWRCHKQAVDNWLMGSPTQTH